MTLFCLFFPAFLSAFIYKKVFKNTSFTDVIIHYGVSSVLSNVIVFVSLIGISGLQYTMYLDSSPLSFVLKFLGLSCFVNVVYSVLYCCVAKRFNIELSVHTEEKNEKNS